MDSGKYKIKCNSCCVPGCKSNSTPSFRNRGGRITTFKLPRDENRRKEWIQAIPRRKYPPTVNHNVCILHFNEEDFSRNNRRIDLTKSAVPSIFPFVNGQRNDECSDVCDEAWVEYVRQRTELSKNALEDETIDLPTASITDISRILIERLRIPGSKYFGVDTNTIIEPDSDIESDICEPKPSTETDVTLPFKSEKLPKMKRRKKVTREDEKIGSVDGLNDVDMNDFSMSLDEHCDDIVQMNEIPDSEDKFGAIVSSKLLLMSPLQRLISQKIISEILLKGQLNLLKSSLSPVVVAGYMRNVSNGVVTNAATACLLSPFNGSNAKEEACDPLMFAVKEEIDRESNLESFVKAEVHCSVSDED